MLFYSSLGIPTSLSKFLPEHEAAGGRMTDCVSREARRVCAWRCWRRARPREPVRRAAAPPGCCSVRTAPLYVHVLSALAIGRALFELVIEGLHSNLGQLP